MAGWEPTFLLAKAEFFCQFLASEIPPISSYLFCGWSISLHREYSQAAFLQQSPQWEANLESDASLRRFPPKNVWGKLHSSAFRTCTVKRSICVQKIEFQRSQSVQMNCWKWWNTRGSWLWKSFDSESLGTNGLQQPLRSSLLTSQWSNSASLLVACGPLWMELVNYAAEEPRLYALVHEPGELPPRVQDNTIHDFMIAELGNRHLCNTVLSSCSTGSPETAVLCWPPVLHFFLRFQDSSALNTTCQAPHGSLHQVVLSYKAHQKSGLPIWPSLFHIIQSHVLNSANHPVRQTHQVAFRDAEHLNESYKHSACGNSVDLSFLTNLTRFKAIFQTHVWLLRSIFQSVHKSFSVWIWNAYCIHK